MLVVNASDFLSYLNEQCNKKKVFILVFSKMNTLSASSMGNDSVSLRAHL